MNSVILAIGPLLMVFPAAKQQTMFVPMTRSKVCNLLPPTCLREDAVRIKASTFLACPLALLAARASVIFSLAMAVHL